MYDLAEMTATEDSAGGAIAPPAAARDAPPAIRQDRRARIPEPLPVQLVAVSDVRLPAAAGLETQLDAFYAGLLGFEREPEDAGLVYRAENHRLIFGVLEPPIAREDMRAVGIEIPSLPDVERKLIAAPIDYMRQKALHPGRESLLLQDPAGNWIELTATRALA